MNAVIMAGGQGTRLWPQSRTNKPKHFHKLIGSETLIQRTVQRIAPLVGEDNILICTNQNHLKELTSQLPKIKNIICEPEAKNTAAAVGLSAIYFKKQGKEKQPVAALPSDHLIMHEDKFLAILKHAFNLIKTNSNLIVILGINPTYPETGYGYIQVGEKYKKLDKEHIAYHIHSFKEKPDLETAKVFVQKWGYLWNAGMFIFRPDTILKAFQKFLPKTYESLEKIEQALGTPDESKVLKTEYAKLESISIDYGIIEKIPKKNIVVVPADIGWSDIGSWSALKDILTTGEIGGNIVVGCEHIGVETTNSLFYGHSSRLIATVGLENMIVVDTPDVTLICPKGKAQDVKKIIDRLKKEGKANYL